MEKHAGVVRMLCVSSDSITTYSLGFYLELNLKRIKSLILRKVRKEKYTKETQKEQLLFLLFFHFFRLGCHVSPKYPSQLQSICELLLLTGLSQTFFWKQFHLVVHFWSKWTLSTFHLIPLSLSKSLQYILHQSSFYLKNSFTLYTLNELSLFAVANMY